MHPKCLQTAVCQGSHARARNVCNCMYFVCLFLYAFGMPKKGTPSHTKCTMHQTSGHAPVAKHAYQVNATCMHEMRQSQIMHTTCIQHACSMLTTCLQHAYNMLTTCLQHATTCSLKVGMPEPNMHTTCTQRNMVDVYIEYAQNACDIHTQCIKGYTMPCIKCTCPAERIRNTCKMHTAWPTSPGSISITSQPLQHHPAGIPSKHTTQHHQHI